MVIQAYSGTYVSASNQFTVSLDNNNVSWDLSSNMTLTTICDNVGNTNNSSLPLKRLFTFNNNGNPITASKAWVIDSNDNTLSRLGFTSSNNVGWVGTWTSSRDGSFTIQSSGVAGSYTVTRNNHTYDCIWIDQTKLTNVVLSKFYDNSTEKPVALVLTNASDGGGAISAILNAANGAWVTEIFNKS